MEKKSAFKKYPCTCGLSLSEEDISELPHHGVRPGLRVEE